jgi:hypothetical protein
MSFSPCFPALIYVLILSLIAMADALAKLSLASDEIISLLYSTSSMAKTPLASIS